MVFLEGGLQWIFDGGFDRRNSAKGGARVKWNFAWTIRQFFSSYAYDVNGGIRLLRYHKMIKIWIPLSPCSYLFDFGNPPSFREPSKLYINPPTLTKGSELCDFIVSKLSVVIRAYCLNAIKNVSLIWMFSKFPQMPMLLTIEISTE